MRTEEMFKKAIESRYDGVCSVYEYKAAKDPTTKLTQKQPVLVLEGQPCRLSYSSKGTLVCTDDAGYPVQEVTLFISPDVVILPGAKIEVTQNGVTAEFEKAGKAVVYQSHQEIRLSLFGGWA